MNDHANALRCERLTHAAADPLRDRHDAPRDLVRYIRKVIDVLSRDDRALACSERAQRHEGHSGIVLMDDARWRAASHDLAKRTGHGWSKKMPDGCPTLMRQNNSSRTDPDPNLAPAAYSRI